jgi:hypothetical protein
VTIKVISTTITLAESRQCTTIILHVTLTVGPTGFLLVGLHDPVHALSYHLTKSRAVQDSNQMYVCIMDTLTKEGRAKVVLHEKEYSFGNGDYVSGTVLLKVVIMESYIDTNATTRHIRQHLSQLHRLTLVPRPSSPFWTSNTRSYLFRHSISDCCSFAFVVSDINSLVDKLISKPLR